MPISKYNQNFDEANTYLRLTLALLGKHKIAPNIINLTLCYEYVMVQGTQLNEELDKLFNSSSFTSEKAEQLFRDHIWDEDKRYLDDLNHVLNEQLVSMLGNIKDVNSSTSVSTTKLDQQAQLLKTLNSPEEIKKISKKILNEANTILEANQTFEEKLNKTQAELDELKKEFVQTKAESETDPLTGLKNRRVFEYKLNEEIQLSSSSGKTLSLVMLDIDFFKKVNDQYGHVIGDKVIRFVAKTMLDCIEEKDLASRYGGEEFTIILPNTNQNRAIAIANDVRLCIEKSKLKIPATNELIGNITISAGITTYKKQETWENFIHRADRALYHSKESGRNKVTAI